jgi:hypothetical protein
MSKAIDPELDDPIRWDRETKHRFHLFCLQFIVIKAEQFNELVWQELGDSNDST